MNSLLQPYNIDGNFVRNVLIISCMCIYFLRLLFTLFIFFQRKMYWIEAIVIANIMPWIFPYIAQTSTETTPRRSRKKTGHISSRPRKRTGDRPKTIAQGPGVS